MQHVRWQRNILVNGGCNMEIADLLQKTLEIINEIDTQRKKNGSYFNIFDILGVGHKEVRICMFLHELLSPKGSHGAGSIYLRAFVRDVLQIDETIFKDAEYDNAVVTKKVCPDGIAFNIRYH